MTEAISPDQSTCMISLGVVIQGHAVFIIAGQTLWHDGPVVILFGQRLQTASLFFFLKLCR